MKSYILLPGTAAVFFIIAGFHTAVFVGCASQTAPKAPGTEPTSFADMKKVAAKSNELKNRTSQKQSDEAGPDAPAPWPELSSLVSDSSLHPLQKWLEQKQVPASLSLGQPYTRDAAAYVNQWHSFAPTVIAQSNNTQLSMNTVLLFATFWLRGLQIDADTAAKQMSQLLMNAKTADPTHPLPFALEALFSLRHPEHTDANESFEHALSMEPSDKLKQLLQLGFGLLCFERGNIHQSILHYQQATDIQPVQKLYLPHLRAAKAPFTVSANTMRSPGQLFAQLGNRFSSLPLGFQFEVPAGWRIASSSAFTDTNQEAVIQLTQNQSTENGGTPPPPTIKIIIEQIDALDQASNYLPIPGADISVVRLPLPVPHPYFTKWFQFNARQQTTDRRNTRATTFAAVAEVAPSPWQLADHQAAAQTEGSCGEDNAHRQLSFSMGEETDNGAVIASPGRSNRPLRFIVLQETAATELDATVEQLAEFIETFIIFDKSGTALLNKL
ncbi:MAG: hypothetical protein JXX29_11575 [Deltaproteobacteria bacterium]|nr:hypothetical protein [Deltaproteobacteria bacterium]MBN2672312.1 hypothetical protein [Deltaproteobacteria bacterium]